MSGMWDKAQEAAAEARLLFANARYNGSVTRAYYAMFCAARAALRYVHPDLDQSKTHAGVIRQFGLEIVARGGIDPTLGRMLARMEEIRVEADYDDAIIGQETGQQVMDNMEQFLAAIAAFIGKS
jgi:uncharacterized protein